MKLPFFCVLGLLAFIAEGISILHLVRNMRRSHYRSLLWCLMLAAAIAGFYMPKKLIELGYQLSPKWQVVGFPFPVAFFEDKGDMLWDYVGVFTMVDSYANILVFFLAPQVVVALIHKVFMTNTVEQLAPRDASSGPR